MKKLYNPLLTKKEETRYSLLLAGEKEAGHTLRIPKTNYSSLPIKVIENEGYISNVSKTDYSPSLTRIEIVPHKNCPPITYDIPKNFEIPFTLNYKVHSISQTAYKNHYSMCKVELMWFKQTQKELKLVRGEDNLVYETCSKPIQKHLALLVVVCKYKLEDVKAKVTAALKSCEAGKKSGVQDAAIRGRLEKNCVDTLEECKWIEASNKQYEDCESKLVGEFAYALADFTDCFKYDMT